MTQRLTQRSDIDRGRDIVERWCVLAEKRLDYLTALYESGRWRRFHSEVDFLDNLRDAKAAVEAWRLLASREATPDNKPVDLSWLGQPALPLARRAPVMSPLAGPLPRAAEGEGAAPVLAAAAAPKAEESDTAADLAPPLVVHPGWDKGFDLAAIQERYPLLRNAL
jgi:uncharacterized repeat protein (TIGR03809 family)